MKDISSVFYTFIVRTAIFLHLVRTAKKKYTLCVLLNWVTRCRYLCFLTNIVCLSVFKSRANLYLLDKYSPLHHRLSLGELQLSESLFGIKKKQVYDKH